MTTAESRNDLREMWKIATIIRGDEQALRSLPFMIHYVEPISPLKHPFLSLDKLLFCAENSIPVIYSPAPMAGATAPMTIAGHVAQGLAECFCGLVIHQLKATGGHFITHDHTYTHFHSTQCRPRLICRDGYEKWKESGSRSLMDRARQRLLEILETHRPLPIPREKAQAIRGLVDQFKSE